MNIKKIIVLLISLLILPLNTLAYNKAAVDITKMNISDLQKALNLNIITSYELAQLYLDRIDAYDKDYKAIITINERALDEAKKLDEERSAGNVRSTLHGIPIIVKDNIDVFGMPTTAGSKALSDNYPKKNAEAVQKLIDAGAIILAKANMSEFAFEASSSRSGYGTVKNAYDLEYSAYGSSGGSAVAVAATFAAAALGTDANSSVRLPAAASNLIGIRPTTGVISSVGVLPYDPIRDTIGPLTKTVSDSITIMNIINQNNKEYKISDLKKLRIGIPTDFLKGDNKNNLPENKLIYSEIQVLMETAIKKLEDNNITIVYIDDYYNYQTDYWFNNSLSGYLFCDSFNSYIKNTSSTIKDFYDLSTSINKITNLSIYVESCDSNESRLAEKNILKQEYREYINKIMDENKIDLIMYPTTKNKLLKSSNYSRTQNLSAHASSTINYPAITLPLGFDNDGLPYGIEFMARSNQEDLLYNIASLYENINGNQETPSDLPSLYKIPNNLNKLVLNYTTQLENVKYEFERKWLTNVQKFFRDYASNDNSDQINLLNNQYSNNIKNLILIKNIIFIIIICFFLFIMRKIIIKNTKPNKKC